MKNKIGEMMNELGPIKVGELFVVLDFEKGPKLCYFTLIDEYKLKSKPYDPYASDFKSQDGFTHDPDLLISLLSGNFIESDIRLLKETINI